MCRDSLTSPDEDAMNKMAVNKTYSNRAQVETIYIGQSLPRAIIISFCSGLRENHWEKSANIFRPFIKQRYFVPLISSARKKDRKWLRGHRGHLNCFILKQTRHVIKIPTRCTDKTGKIDSNRFHSSLRLKHSGKTSIKLFKKLGWRGVRKQGKA